MLPAPGVFLAEGIIRALRPMAMKNCPLTQGQRRQHWLRISFKTSDDDDNDDDQDRDYNYHPVSVCCVWVT